MIVMAQLISVWFSDLRFFVHEGVFIQTVWKIDIMFLKNFYSFDFFELNNS